MRKLLALLMIVFPCLLFAQDNKKILIKPGKLFNSETGVFQTDMAIIVEGNKIESVKPFKDVSDKEKKNARLLTFQTTPCCRA